MRVVLDANVLVSALLSRHGAPAQLVERWLAGDLDLIVSERLLEEVERTLTAPKLAARIDAVVAAEFVALIREVGELVRDPEEPAPVSSADPGDDYLLGLAAAERVPLVSGDGHLLALRDRVPVRTPREFLDSLD